MTRTRTNSTFGVALKRGGGTAVPMVVGEQQEKMKPAVVNQAKYPKASPKDMQELQKRRREYVCNVPRKNITRGVPALS